uniref:Sporulation protein YunB n=1 Tax=uncultured prokaryote TaxID=198431 RepID=A0A0H5Q3X6_9ZZZZ|nr:hypothetical protein [uncultured prokaryote]
MGRVLLRRIWLRNRSSRGIRRERSQLFAATLVGLATALFLIWRFNAALRPQLITLAQAQIRNHLTHISNQAVTDVLAEQSLSYSDMVILQTGAGGEVQTMSVDAVKLNNFRSAVVEQVVVRACVLESQDLGVPFGMLTGIDFISALGPKLPVRVTTAASVEGHLRNEFIDAGINQTLHRIMLDITVTAKLLLPGGSTEIEIITPVCVTEAVIVGRVPQTYFELNQ